MTKDIVPDLVVMDVLMPGRDGIESCREIMDALPDVRVLMLTASTEKDAVLEAVAAGANGYLQKLTGTEQLLNTVRDVAKGEYRMPRDAMRRVFGRLRNALGQSVPSKRPRLTEREREILTQFAKGMSYSAIAESRGNRPPTIPQHHLRHTEQAGIRQQAGGHRVGRTKRTAGLKSESVLISDSAQDHHA